MDAIADDKSRASKYFAYVVFPSGFVKVNEIEVEEFKKVKD